MELVLSFVVSGDASGEQEAVKRVMETVGELGVQNAESKRIEEAVLEALHRATHRVRGHEADTSVAVRLWISRLIPLPLARNAPAPGIYPDLQSHQGWGFFLVERPEEASRVADAGGYCILELHLYQESVRDR